MKKLTRDELKENAKRLLDAHGKEKVYATQDGNYFFAHHDAINHNGSLKQGTEWDGEVITFTKEEFVPAKPEAPVKSQAEIEKEQAIADAEKTVKDAEKNLKKASDDYNKADKKLEKKPTDAVLKKAQEEAKGLMDAAQVILDNAKTVLEALTPKQ